MESTQFDADVTDIVQSFAYDPSKVRNREHRTVRIIQLWVIAMWAVSLGMSWITSTRDDKLFGLAIAGFFLLLLEAIRCTSSNTEYVKKRRVAVTTRGIRKEKKSSRGVVETIPLVYATTVVRCMHKVPFRLFSHHSRCFVQYPFSEIEDVILEPPKGNRFLCCLASKEPKIMLRCRGTKQPRTIVLDDEGALEDPNAFVVACRQQMANTTNPPSGSPTGSLTDVELTTTQTDEVPPVV